MSTLAPPPGTERRLFIIIPHGKINHKLLEDDELKIKVVARKRVACALLPKLEFLARDAVSQNVLESEMRAQMIDEKRTLRCGVH